jgi:hypothetical protein
MLWNGVGWVYPAKDEKRCPVVVDKAKNLWAAHILRKVLDITLMVWV